MKNNALLLYLLLCSFLANGQSFLFEQYEIGNTFENFGSFTTSLVDSKGHLWVGSNASSLGKLSEDIWEVIKLNDIMEGAPGNARIADLYEDKKGRIWAISNKGIFLHSNDQWVFFKEELEKDFGYSIAEKEDTLYFSTRGGVMTYSDENWAYQAIIGNQPGFVSVDNEGYIWVSSSNGDSNFKYIEGKWIEVTDVCTNYALASSTSPNGDLWIIGASGAICSYDGTSFRDYRLDGGVLSVLNSISFSPSGDHVFIGGEDSFSDRKIKHFFENELVDVYGSSTGLPEQGEVISLAVASEVYVYAFFENEIYRGFLFSSTNELEQKKIELQSTLVENHLEIKGGSIEEGVIFSSSGAYKGAFKSTQGLIDVSSLSSGLYLLCVIDKGETITLKFVKL